MLLRVTLTVTGTTTLMSSLVTKLLLFFIPNQPMVLHDHIKSIPVELLKIHTPYLQTKCKTLHCVAISVPVGTVSIDNLQVPYLCKAAYK